MTLLKVRGLGKAFGGVKAVDGIDFDLAAGELLALIGPNGAGKSTTFNMVNGQLRADRCSVQLDGRRSRFPDRRNLRVDDRTRERSDGAHFPCRPAVFLMAARAGL